MIRLYSVQVVTRIEGIWGGGRPGTRRQAG
jgi:hypothetical protein